MFYTRHVETLREDTVSVPVSPEITKASYCAIPLKLSQSSYSGSN